MSGTARILERLRQGPATAAELYALHCIVHSRISELRKQGHRIVCSRTPGVSGPGAYVYRIVDGSLTGQGVADGTPMEPARHRLGASPSVSDQLTCSEPEPQPSEGFALSGSAVVGRPSGSEQLSLDVAA